MNVACDYETPMQMLTTEKYIAAGPLYKFLWTIPYGLQVVWPRFEDFWSPWLSS